MTSSCIRRLKLSFIFVSQFCVKLAEQTASHDPNKVKVNLIDYININY